MELKRIECYQHHIFAFATNNQCNWFLYGNTGKLQLDVWDDDSTIMETNLNRILHYKRLNKKYFELTIPFIEKDGIAIKVFDCKSEQEYENIVKILKEIL